jgi:hypothetical protein
MAKQACVNHTGDKTIARILVCLHFETNVLEKSCCKCTEYCNPIVSKHNIKNFLSLNVFHLSPESLKVVIYYCFEYIREYSKIFELVLKGYSDYGRN